jgi:hypothetical protein
MLSHSSEDGIMQQPLSVYGEHTFSVEHTASVVRVILETLLIPRCPYLSYVTA